MTQESPASPWWTGAYPLALALMAGAAWMDRIYSHALHGRAVDEVMTLAAHRAADRLLLLGAIVFVAGLVAVWSWRGRARTLCAASLAVFCLEFMLPAMAQAIPGGEMYFQMLGPALRTSILLGALALAALASRDALA